MSKTTKTERLLSFLQNGNDITATQAQSRFGIANISAVASNLRQRGYAIYANQKTLPSGNTVRMYRLGTPTRAVVAAGYALLAA